jgi:hypothetical protein
LNDAGVALAEIDAVAQFVLAGSQKEIGLGKERAERIELSARCANGIARIMGFDHRKCHDSFDFVFPNQSCHYSHKAFVLKRFENV